MDHGPCAGVRSDGACEVADFGPCSFLDVEPVEWPYRLETVGGGALAPACAAARRFLVTAAARPVVVADLPSVALSADSERATAGELAGSVDACLLGDHPNARLHFPPSYRARLLADEGVPAWLGINCRDRNRVAIEGEIAACVDAGAVGLHCITGAHPVSGHRPDAAAVFDLDCIDVVALARSRGALCSVAHAPAAPPQDRRLSRLLAKVDAGAQVVFVDHCGGPAYVADAVGGLRSAGFGGLVLGCVPVVTSAETASVLESLVGERLPAAYATDIVGAADPALTGIAAATEMALRMLEIPGVDGVNLAGGVTSGQERTVARQLAEVSRRVLGS